MSAAPLALLLSLVTHPDTATEDPIVAACRELLVEYHRQSRFPGATAAVVLPDGKELTLAVGWASREEEISMLPEHRLFSGSVGKTYVTAALHHLREHSELDFDQRAAEYFTGEEDAWFLRLPNAKSFTLHQLLRHESGLPRYVFRSEFWTEAMGNPDRVWKPEELLGFLLDERPLFSAGDGWAYSDTNYIVLGMILERVSGVSFYDYVERHFLAPLKLADTLPSTSRSIPGVVQGYVVGARGMGVPEHVLEDGVMVFNPQFEWCGGGYVNTSLDLARWARTLYRGEAFEGDYLDSMLDTVPADALGEGRHYGLGLIRSETELGDLLGHDGFFPGYLTSMGYFPDLDIAVAIQMNTDNAPALGRRVHEILVELAQIARDLS